MTPEEEAEDARAEEELERVTRRGPIRQVLTPTEAHRRDGLTITAVVTRAESVEVHFHFVGPPRGDETGGWARHEAFVAIVESLAPPRLGDDVGTTYEAVAERPVESSGTGGAPDPERPHVITGAWRYLPAAPDDARSFSVRRDDARWIVGA